jgi:hypothetical protein
VVYGRIGSVFMGSFVKVTCLESSMVVEPSAAAAPVLSKVFRETARF